MRRFASKSAVSALSSRKRGSKFSGLGDGARELSEQTHRQNDEHPLHPVRSRGLVHRGF